MYLKFTLVLSYKNNIKIDSLVFLPNSSKQIAEGSNRGITGNGGFYSSFIANSDSFIVVFNNTNKISHYNKVVQFSTKYYTYESKRNLFNLNSYEYSNVDKNKNTRNNQFNYFFTEQDYLDTK